MEVTIKMIIMSHLSDVQAVTQNEMTAFKQDTNHKINFVKYLIMNYQDTDVEVDADEVYNEFKTNHPNL